ncbi:MAG TPA: peptide-methionine (S)-S-oxide reductase MsrA [Oculatellaceae cyanobacterium]
MEKATFAAGCFWGVEETFRSTPGVSKTQVGYIGGNVEKPSYEQVCSGRTGHAEAVQADFDPNQVSYEELVKLFFNSHNPTTLNRQGPDVGEQYRSAIFYHNDAQKQTAELVRDQVEQSKKFANKIVTQIVPAPEFYAAEEYHQQYLLKRGISHCHT